MDLWIRSQDRTKLVKADNISYMDTAEDYKKEFHSLWNDCKGILGTYKTKERALEVLDEIQNAILGILSLEDIEEQKIKQYTGFACLSKVTNCLVYEMPKE